MRIDLRSTAPDVYRAFGSLEKYIRSSGLPDATVDLLYLRISQLNGCAYCVDSHSADLKKLGEDDRRVWGVAAWRESPFYTPAERAALALAEEGTLLPGGHGVSDAVWEEAAAHYPEELLAALIATIAQMNAMNRLGVINRLSPQP
ncbi:carboxymuconolactone decarboxylase family protein [Actinocorallia populi]|uniref:carboxymuconolactone decarboxylase family protein n=1 Tax=Actinocorallia populi TaxID=2079200 RepID=UPI000D095769|nr:carboxymuconolactone decarboxylase family protein [Actinocorallia populi]